jgi:transmembrane sensor
MNGWFSAWRQPRTAAQWFALRRATSTPAIERRFGEWLSQDPSHGEEYALCELLWEAAKQAVSEEPAPARIEVRAHWRIGAFAVAASIAVVSIAVVSIVFLAKAPQTWTTGAGEQRTVLLADGSWVTLNTRTRIDVHLSRHARDIELREGEAFFAVAKDAARPFTVHTSLGYARAVGTQFNAYVNDERLQVTTEQGSVLVDGLDSGAGVLVDAGMQAELRIGMPGPRVTAANLTAVMGWREQRLEVDDAPLADVLKDFGRYTPTSIRAASPEIGSLRVSAVLRVGDLAALEAMLSGAFGLQFERQGREIIVVRPSAARAPKS